jgi:uncharacterized protein
MCGTNNSVGGISMTPEERQLITDLFERMRSYDAPEKDRDAERLISQSVRANPDAPYLLVQSVLVQEQALQQANDHIQDLEQRLREYEGPPARSQGSGSFLGARGGERDARGSSVPQIGGRATPSPYAQGGSSPWSQQQAPGAPPPAQGGGGGGFMRTALSAAAGVAGGMLLADGIRNMMGGGAAHAGSLGGERSSESLYRDADRAQDREQDADEAQDAAQDAEDNDFDSGGEMDI